jgi:hypothetical protein
METLSAGFVVIDDLCRRNVEHGYVVTLTWNTKIMTEALDGFEK